MNISTLSYEETCKYGFTHKVVIGFADFAGTDALTKTISLVGGLGVGTIIKEAAFRLVTGFAGTSVTNLGMEIGYNLAAGTDDPNAIIESVELASAATEVLGGDGTGAIFATKRTGYAPQEGAAIEALFTAQGANVSALTAGEVVVFLTVLDLSKL